MPHHDATTWKLPAGYEGPVGNANIEIEIRYSPTRLKATTTGGLKRRSELLGHLLISKGGLEWRPPKGRKLVKMRWEKFAAEMDKLR